MVPTVTASESSKRERKRNKKRKVLSRQKIKMKEAQTNWRTFAQIQWKTPNRSVKVLQLIKGRSCPIFNGTKDVSHIIQNLWAIVDRPPSGENWVPGEPEV